MSNELSNNLLEQMYAQNSEDPFLMLLTLSHSSFDTIYLANNTESVVSNSNTFLPFPMRVTLPTDDGESVREFGIEFDNVTRELIDELRSVLTPINVKIEMVLASDPDYVEIEFDELKLRDINYTKTSMKAKLYMDDFLNTELTSERYTPSNFPGIFS